MEETLVVGWWEAGFANPILDRPARASSVSERGRVRCGFVTFYCQENFSACCLSRSD